MAIRPMITVTLFGPAPELAIEKRALTASFNAVGDTLSYEYIVTNTGNVTLTDEITVADDRIENVTCPALPATGLAPNGQITCTGEDTATQADIDAGAITNVASARSGDTTSPEMSVTVEASQIAAFMINKTVGAPIQVGGPLYDVTYTIVLENTGNVTLTNLALVDDLAAAFAPAIVTGTPTLSQSGRGGG